MSSFVRLAGISLDNWLCCYMELADEVTAADNSRSILGMKVSIEF